MRTDGLLKKLCFGVQVADDDLAVLRATYGPEQGYSGKYKDDLTGQVFKDALVLQARAVELENFKSKGVRQKMLRNVVKTTSCKSPISVSWVDTNKGDELNPNYRL